MTTNDTRTPNERADALALEQYPPPSERLRSALGQRYQAMRAGFIAGFMARDAEPTTVTAGNRAKAIRALWLWDVHSGSDRYEDAVDKIFRAAGFRIEGEGA